MKLENDWSMKITRADNGFIVETIEELLDDSGLYRTHRIVIDEDEGELQAMQSLLWEVLEHFAVYKGISIEIEEGDKEK